MILVALKYSFFFLLNRNIIIAESKPPIRAARGNPMVVKISTALFECPLFVRTNPDINIYIVTNTLAPELTPSVPGEAKELCIMSCMIAPATPIPIPTSIPKTIFGNLSRYITFIFDLSPLPNIAFTVSLYVNPALPI